MSLNCDYCSWATVIERIDSEYTGKRFCSRSQLTTKINYRKVRWISTIANIHYTCTTDTTPGIRGRRETQLWFCRWVAACRHTLTVAQYCDLWSSQRHSTRAVVAAGLSSGMECYVGSGIWVRCTVRFGVHILAQLVLTLETPKKFNHWQYNVYFALHLTQLSMCHVRKRHWCVRWLSESRDF